MNPARSIDIEVKLFNDLQQYGLGGKNAFHLTVSDGTRIIDLLEKLKIPPDSAHVVLVNGRRQPKDTILSNNDLVVFFSPVAGG